MHFVVRSIAVMCVASLFAGCTTAGPRNTGAQAANASGSPNSAAIAGITETDRKMVAAGLDPPEILKYDAEIAEMIPEGEDIIAKGDKVRGTAWKKKYNAVMKARYNSIQRFSANSIAAAHAITNTFGGIGRPVDQSPGPAQSDSRDPNLPDGFSDWCQNPADPTRLVPCNH